MFAKTILPILVIAFLSVGGYYVWSTDETEAPVDRMAEIEGAIVKNAQEGSGIRINNLKVTHSNLRYSRASFNNSNTDSGNAFLIKIADEWEVVDINQDGTFFCEKMEKYGFPATFIQDCLLEYPQAITVADFLKEEDKQKEGIKIIGIVGPDNDNDSGTDTITSGGETITVTHDPDDEDWDDVDEGDQVIIDPGDNIEEDEDGEVTVDAEDVEEVNEDEDPEDPVDGGNDNEENPDPQDNGEETGTGDDNPPTQDEDEVDDEEDDYDITDYPPDPAPDDDYNVNLWDIDNSNVLIEIIGD